MKRNGSSLIETAISLPIFSMLMVLAVGGVQQTMRVSRLAKDRGELACSLAKLEQSLRLDIHASDSAIIEKDEKTGLLSLRLAQLEGGNTVYRIRVDRVDREHLSTDGKKLTDSFALFPQNRVDLHVEENRRVRVAVYRKHRDHSEVDRLEMLVRSTIGRSHETAPDRKGDANANALE